MDRWFGLWGEGGARKAKVRLKRTEKGRTGLLRGIQALWFQPGENDFRLMAFGMPREQTHVVNHLSLQDFIGTLIENECTCIFLWAFHRYMLISSCF